MAINIEKIEKELSKGSPDELYAAFQKIKEFVKGELSAHQKILDEKASELQSKIEKVS